jgi:hypothetical protein
MKNKSDILVHPDLQLGGPEFVRDLLRSLKKDCDYFLGCGGHYAGILLGGVCRRISVK